MTTPHKATPEQWKATEEYAHAAIGCYSDSCILELRDRIAALEVAANCRAILGSSPAPAGGLVERVAERILDAMWISDEEAARAAILAVAGWLEHRNAGALHCAALLREEVQCNG